MPNRILSKLINGSNSHEIFSGPDLLALLERVERDDPTLGEGVLSVEVDKLLGRERKPPDATLPDSKSDDGDSATPYGWFSGIIASTPEVPGPFRVQRAARAIEAGLFASERLSPESGASREHREDLAEIARRGSAEYGFLIESNLRLVFHWARKIEHLVGEDLLQDAFQAGCIGLMRGIQGWDHELGYTLSTYVSWHIRQAIQRWRYDETTIIRLPAHVWERLNTDSRELSDPVRAAAERALNVEPLTSLDIYSEAFAWDGGLEDVIAAHDRRQLVARILENLSMREADILRLRHGLDGEGTPRTLDEVGRIYGLTRERIRQIESEVTKKLKAVMADEVGRDFY